METIATDLLTIIIQVFRTLDEKELDGTDHFFSFMLGYVSYEIERLSAFKNDD